jgi:hypothetical protein
MTLTATEANFEMFAGDTFEITNAVTDDDDEPVILTNATIKWALKRSAKSAVDEVYKDQDDGINVNLNEFTIPLLPEDTVDLDGLYYHECEVTHDGDVFTSFYGQVTIRPSGV